LIINKLIKNKIFLKKCDILSESCKSFDHVNHFVILGKVEEQTKINSKSTMNVQKHPETRSWLTSLFKKPKKINIDQL